MIYTANITVPSNTLATSPELKRIQVTKGLVYKVEIDFPPGPSGLTHIKIYDGSHPVWPSNPDVDFASDDFTISFDDTYLKTIPPFEFQIYGYNQDDTYDHTIQVRIGLVSKDIFMARFLPTYAYEHFLKLIAKLEEAEAARALLTMEKPFSWIG